MEGAATVVFDNDVLNRSSLRVVTGNDLLDGTRDAGVNGTSKSLLHNTDHLSNQNGIPGLYNGSGVNADMLREGDRNKGRLGKAHGANPRGILVLMNVRAPSERKLHK